MRRFSSAVAKAAEKAHYGFQVGMYFSGHEQIEGALLLHSDKIEDPYWNYAALIDVSKERLEDLIREVSEYFQSRNRQPCFYLTPFTRPRDFSGYLTAAGFEVGFADAWMFYEAELSPKIARPSDFFVKEVQAKKEMETFVRIFNEAYGGVPTPDEPYAGLPPSYAEALYESFGRQLGEKVTHYLGFLGEEAVGIATLISGGGYACIYNVGTTPMHRRKGVGSALSLRAAADARKRANKGLFLLTEKGSAVERWYTDLGFSTWFAGEAYVPSA